MVAINLIFAIFLIIHRMALFHLENFTAAKEVFSDALKLDSKQNKIYFILRKRRGNYSIISSSSQFACYCMSPRQAKD